MAEAIHRREPLAPLPTEAPVLNASRVALGEKLFNDGILSKDGTVSCASCHPLERAGADNLPRSRGVGGALGTINAPSVFNASLNFSQFWDGRAATLEDQVSGPIHNPVEMASSWGEIIDRLQRRDDYREAFRQAYPEGINANSIADAIATFEKSLLTPNAPFDRYLQGEVGALTTDEIEGYARFKEMGCASCHQGVNIGGNLYQRFGVMGDYFASRGDLQPSDRGRFNLTGLEEDRHVFKVPSLRNVALTAPYFHDGSVERLDDAVKIMAKYQLGRDLSDEDLRLIVAFLSSLTGTYRGVSLQ